MERLAVLGRRKSVQHQQGIIEAGLSAAKSKDGMDAHYGLAMKELAAAMTIEGIVSARP
jgi:hypothetical protein